MRPLHITKDDLESKTFWICKLSNNEEIWSDDEYINEKSDWQRLKDYCESNDLTIESFKIKFRDRYIELPKSSKYFFRRMILCSFGKKKKNNKNYFVLGYENLGKIHIQKYMIPELDLWEEEYRDIDKCEDSLIG